MASGKVTVPSQSTRRPPRSFVRTAAKIYFAPFAALLMFMAGILVVGLASFAVQIVVILFRSLHL
jgi:hypothetical protein